MDTSFWAIRDGVGQCCVVNLSLEGTASFIFSIISESENIFIPVL